MTRWQTKLPWNDRKGAFSPLKALTLALVILPGALIAWRLGTGQLGAKPITEALHQTGLWAIRLLLVTLAVTPFRLITGYNRIVLIRRMLGVAALAYGLVHLGLYVFDQRFDLVRVGSEIALRFYLTIGFIALLAMLALGITSTDGMIRRMGAPAWKRLHLLVWPLTLLGLWHGALQSKIDAGEHILMTGLLFALAGVRLMRGRVPLNAPALLGLALISTALAAGVEYLWYALATGLPAARVFAANFMLALQPRPALLVGLIALALPLLALGARMLGRRTA